MKVESKKASSHVNCPVMVTSNKAVRTIIRVLHVDDDIGFLSVSKECLEAQGNFEVQTTSSIKEAMKKLKKGKYDAVVSDYQLPGKDGLQFLKELRQKGNNIPFIVFTGKGREEVVIKALNLGADHYENKSGDPETVYCGLGHAIRTAVERKRTAEERLKAEKALRENEEKYRTLINSLPEIAFEADKQGNLTFVNKSAYAVTGYTEEDFFAKGLNALDFPVPEHRSNAQESMKKVLTGEKTGTHEYTFKRKDGRTFTVLRSSNPVVHEGKIIGLGGIIVDISERARTEEELKRFSSAVKMSSEGVVVTDLNGRIIEANDAAMRSYSATTKDELVGKNVVELVDPQERHLVLERMKEASEKGSTRPHEYSVNAPPGTKLFIELTTTAMGDKEGKTYGFVSIIRDVTERKKAEEKLRNEREELDCIINSSPIIVFYKDKEGKILRANKAFAKALQISEEEFVGKTVFDLYSAGIAQSMTNDDLEVLESGCPKIGIIEQYESANGLRWVQTDKVPILGENGVPNGIIGFAQDITERKKAEERLEQRNHSLSVLNDVSNELASLPQNVTIPEYLVKKLRDITGALAVSFADYDASKKTLMPQLLEVEPLWQDEVTRVLGKNLRDMRCPVSKKVYREIISSVVGERKELTDATFGGIPPSTGAEVQKMLGIDHFIGVAYVLEGELYGTSLLALKSDMADPAREILRSFAQMASVSLRRRRAEERMRESERVLQDSQRRYQTIVESVQDGLTIIEEGKVTYVNDRACEIFGRSRAELLKTNGVDLAASEAKERLQRIQGETINSGKALEELEFWIARKDGTRRCILNRYSHITKDGSTRVVATTDITARKNTVDKLETVTQKLQVVGGLTRHDVRNKLSAISSNAFLAKKTLTKGHKALTHLERIESACKQAASILDFAAIYEKLGLEKLTLVDVGTSIDEAVSLFPDMKSVDVVNECHGVSVLADSLLSQLFYNLIDNSLKHGKKVNLIRIHCEIRKKGLKLSYEDNGVGIPKANKPKLFDEGFSTGNGQGYGLPLIKKMIEVYGWTIEESGEVDKGAKFIIRIPTHTTSNSFSPQLIQ